MSHLTHEVCGVDFFLAYNKCSQNVIDLIDNLKLYFNSHRITHFSNDHTEFNQNYLQNFQLQAIRSKIYLFFIDKYALECEWFLSLYVYAKERCLMNHMPILIPIIFDDELEVDYEDDLKTEFDKNLKLKLIRNLTSDCIFSINMSEISSFKVFVENLKEAIVDIIPIKDEIEASMTGVEKRYADNKRPMTSEEETFFRYMKDKESELIQKFEISRSCMRYILPKLKTYVALSVPYTELNAHLTTMMNVQCHLIWMDCICINKINFFNLIWQTNDEKHEINSLNQEIKSSRSEKSFCAESISYLIFYDLNTAQLANFYQKFCIENNWSIQLVESYVKTPEIKEAKRTNRPQTSKSRPLTSKSSKLRPQIDKLIGSDNNIGTEKSYDEIFYICQIKKKTQPNEVTNKLHQAIIDSRFDETFKETVKYSKDRAIYIPLRSTALLVNVNTMTNKHFYYTNLYMPYKNFQPADGIDYNDKASSLKETSLFSICKNLTDLELLKLYETNTKKSWKLVDLKAYKDEKSTTKFTTIWSSRSFYEGTSRLLIGLNKSECLEKIDEMSLKGMYPKIVTSYCYLNSERDHLYALFFCQF